MNNDNVEFCDQSSRKHLQNIFISGYFDFTYNVQPDPTDTNHWQTIGDYPSASGGERGESTVKGYDEKYNIPEGSEFDAQKVKNGIYRYRFKWIM